MNTINILIIVDAAGAIAGGTLMGNVYMVDTNKYIGSWQEGTDNLYTVCRDGQLLCWRVVSVSADDDVEIDGFEGDIVAQGICQPVKQGDDNDLSWEGRVETKGEYAGYGYTVALTIDGRRMTFSPNIKVV